MKRFLLPIIIFAFTNLQLYSKSIDEPTAKTVACNFLASVSGNSQLKNGENIELIYKAAAPVDQSLKSSPGFEAAQTAYFYIFSSSKTDNFVIVSGDDRTLPILGYSTTSCFDPGKVPPNMQIWLKSYEHQIQYVFDNDILANTKISENWLELLQGINTNTTFVVAPLLTTRWDQVPPYNDLCPYDNTTSERTMAGCGATAMAQILKYWNYPAQGIGSNSYISQKQPELGAISVDFENTHYNWASMPNTISGSNEEIARLIFHCGVSMNTDYGILDNGGSDNHSFYYNHPCALLAFRKYFGYKHTNRFVAKSFYNTNSEWLNLIKKELDAKRPVFYGADDDNEGGHSFVCDGYDNNNYLHFNWGWGGMSNGYFTTEAIDLGYRDYTNQQDAIIGIEPLTVNPDYDIQFNSKVVVSPAVYLKEGQAFSVTTDFTNLGAATFEGNFSAEINNSSGQWVANINTSDKYVLASGESTGLLTFSSSGISALTPGTYLITFWKITNQMKLIESSLSENGYTQRFKKIIVTNEQQPIRADEFENNDTEITAYEFIPEFSDKISETKFTANIHAISDVDYYKIKIPTGFHYTVGATVVEDAQASLGANVFPLDGIFLYKLEDNSWSLPEDLYSKFNCTGDNGYLYFRIEPASIGNMGTYKISLYITQGDEITSSGEILAKSSVNVYPTPNDGHFTLLLGNKNKGKNEITILSINGTVISKILLENPSEVSKEITLDVPNGFYFLKVENNNNSTTRKIIVNR